VLPLPLLVLLLLLIHFSLASTTALHLNLLPLLLCPPSLACQPPALTLCLDHLVV
jgi:hypothetical protein